MHSKNIYAFASLLFLAVMALYFYLHPSYRLSLEAKIYYTIGDYDSAYEVASKAYEINSYNTMAFTVMVQSSRANEYRDFIAFAKESYEKIEAISQQEDITKADRIRIKMLAEVVIEKYKRLNSTKLTDKGLIEDAKYYNDTFLKLYENLFETKDGLKKDAA
jgi:hypothetical protein